MRQRDITDRRPGRDRRGRPQRVAWFVGLWLAGVATLAGVAGLIRWMLGVD
jgi:hypothetical protein